MLWAETDLNSERGVGIVLMALILSVILLFTALVIDGSTALTTERQLIVAAEQASVAAAQRIMLRTRQVQREVSEKGEAFEVSYANMLREAEQSAQQVMLASKVLGKVSGAQKLSTLKTKLAGCSESWCNGSLEDGATIEPGRWYRIDDGVPAPENAIESCNEAAELPCFVPLTKDDVGKNAAPALGANAFRVTSALDSPLRYYFAEIFGIRGTRLVGSAISWIAPTNAMFLVDLSPSVHQDTHLLRPTKFPGTNTLIPGMKTEFAFNSTSTTATCNEFCANSFAQDPFAKQFAPQDMLEGFVSGFEIIDGMLGVDENDPNCTPVVGPDVTCPVFGNTICTTDYCDWNDMRPSGCDPAVATEHCRDQYQPVSVAVADFAQPAPVKATLSVDVSVDPATGRIRGAQPLFGILDGINYGAKLFQRRSKGDRIGLMGFDWELFPPDADNVSRIFLPADKYDVIVDATNTKLTPAEATDMSRASPLSKFLFSRGLYFRDKELYPIPELSNATDLKQPLSKTYEILTALQTPNSRNFAMLFSDGRPNCTGDPLTEPVTQRCGDTYNSWDQALTNLRSGTGSIQAYRDAQIPIHVVLYDAAFGTHTLNVTTSSASTDSCMNDSTAREADIPYVHDDCASQSLKSARDQAFVTATDVLGSPNLEACEEVSISDTYYEILEVMEETGQKDLLKVALLAMIKNPGIIKDVQQLGKCCDPATGGMPACVAGIITSLGCNDACCVLYRASSHLGTSRIKKQTVFYGPNDKFYKIAVDTNGLWSPLRLRDMSKPVGEKTNQADEGVVRKCTRVFPGDADPFHGKLPQRQIFDPWGRERNTQIMDAIDAVVDEVPIMLVE